MNTYTGKQISDGRKVLNLEDKDKTRFNGGGMMLDKFTEIPMRVMLGWFRDMRDSQLLQSC